MTGCLWGQSVCPVPPECGVRATGKATELQGRVHRPLPLPTAPAVSLSALYSAWRWFLVILVLNFIHLVQARAGPHLTDEEPEAKERKQLTRGHSRSLDCSPGSLAVSLIRACSSSEEALEGRLVRLGQAGATVWLRRSGDMTINLALDSGAQSEKWDRGTCVLLLCSAKDVAGFLSPHGLGKRSSLWSQINQGSSPSFPTDRGLWSKSSASQSLGFSICKMVTIRVPIPREGTCPG